MERNRRSLVVIVDDQPVFREAARRLLEARGYEVVAEAGCAAAAIEAVQRHQPDLMLIDVHLGEDDGFAVSEAVTRAHPGLAVVLASAEKNYELLRERVESCGARAFIRKEHLPRFDFAPLLRSA